MVVVGADPNREAREALKASVGLVGPRATWERAASGKEGWRGGWAQGFAGGLLQLGGMLLHAVGCFTRHTVTPALSLIPSLPHSFSLILSLPHSLSLILCYTRHAVTPALSLFSFALTHSLSLPPSLPPSLTLALSPSRPLPLSSPIGSRADQRAM